MALNSVDLPTLGLPTITTEGRGASILPSYESAGRRISDYQKYA
jgi:hypothetical protein